MPKKIKCAIRGLSITLLCMAGIVAMMIFLLKPGLSEKREIYKGVYLKVEDINNRQGEKSRVMAIEIHWDTPGIIISNREYSYPVDRHQEQDYHYRLSFADFALIKEGAAILMNTALYYPDTSWRLLPGLPVSANETMVQHGRVSHVHPHTYLLYWDRDMEAHMLTHKPPDPASLENAWIGIGIQGVPIQNGKAVYHAIGNKEEYFDRTFIGVDPEKKILYLFAFKEMDAFTAIDYAVAAGTKYGGQLDSGRSCNLLVGYGAKNVLPHTGIRNSRPLGPYLVIKADRL